MDSKKNMEDKIEQALNSMDNHYSAKPRPYLMSRINAALAARKSETAWDKIYSIITRPVIAFAGIAFILVLNFLIISSYQENNKIKFQTESGSDWQSYSTATNNALYDIENNIEP